MSFERRPKFKNRDYKVVVSVLQHPSQTSPESYLLRKQKTTCFYFRRSSSNASFLVFPHESLGVIDRLRRSPPFF